MTISSRAICSPPSRARSASIPHPTRRLTSSASASATLPVRSVPAVIDALARERLRIGRSQGDLPRLRRRSRAMTSCTRRSSGYYKTHGVELARRTRSSSPTARRADLGNILDIFGKDNVVLVPDPGLPGLRRHQRHGRPQDHLSRTRTAANGFLPLPDASGTAPTSSISAPPITPPARSIPMTS